MDVIRAFEAQYRISHRHADGTWSDMVPRPAGHDPAETDPEHAWPGGHVFRCTTCDDEILVRPEETSPSGP